MIRLRSVRTCSLHPGTQQGDHPARLQDVLRHRPDASLEHRSGDRQHPEALAVCSSERHRWHPAMRLTTGCHQPRHPTTARALEGLRSPGLSTFVRRQNTVKREPRSAADADQAVPCWLLKSGPALPSVAWSASLVDAGCVTGACSHVRCLL